uniref:G-protein coupled receptors family 3 profile domain-containing protein n=1 Tax=Lates calcarifer TaxID=8187 RepID=A0A4W6CAG0_LATCA
MKAAITHRLNRTWIASDTWSTSSGISAMQGIKLAGQVFGFISKRNEVPGFKDYVISMGNGSNNQDGSKQCLPSSCLANYIDQDESYNIYLAVQVIVDGLRRLLKCDNQKCERSANFTAFEVTVYNCSKTCEPGQELRLQHKGCCRECAPCASGEFSPGNGKCQYSSPKKNECWNKSDEFLGWTDPFIIFLCVLGVSGIIISIVFAILFLIYHSTPIVKAVGGYLCFLELFSLLACFCLTFSFVGIPTNLSYMFIHPELFISV